MRWLFVFLLSISFQLHAKRVSDVCSVHKIKADSIMRGRYGDAVFEQFLRFSPLHSYAVCKNKHQRRWKNKLRGDTIRTVHLAYEFVFPGTNPHYRIFYSVTLDDTAKVIRSWPRSSRRCLTVSPQTLNRFSTDSLQKPLKKCSVRFFDYQSLVIDTAHTIELDSTHIYLEVEYNEYRESDRGFHFERKKWGFVVDACTGEFIGRTYFYYYGTKGSF